MAPTVRGTATGVKNGADVLVSLPAATAVGDLVVPFIGVDYGFASNLRGPAALWSWTQRAVANDIETNALHGKAFSALAEAAGATVLTFPNAAASQADMAIGVVVLTAGTFDPDSPFEDPEVVYSTTSGTAHAAPSSSYTAGDRLHLAAALTRTGTSYTPPSGYTELLDVASRTYVTVSVASATIGASGTVEGTTGARTLTAAASAVWAALSLLVRPAPTVAGRNDIPAPRGNTSAWGGSGSSGATITPNTAVSGMDAPTATRVVNGSGAAGNARVSAPAAIYSTDQGGRQFSARMQGRPSAQASCSVEFAFRNASGAAISTTTTTATTVAANALHAPTAQAVAPAGTYRVTATFLARNLAAGATLDGTAARVQPDSTSTALPYADGYTSGWRYEGPSTTSASSAGTPRQTLTPPGRASTLTAGSPTVARKGLWQLDTTQADVVAAGAKASGSQRQRDDASGFNDTTVPWPAVIEAAPDGVRSVTFTVPANYRRYEAVANVRDWVVGDDVYFAWEFYLDPGFPIDATEYQVVWQLHAAPSTGSPPVAVEVRGGALRLSGGANRPGASTPGQYAYDLLLLADVRTGRRYRGITRVVFSDQPGGGRVDVWVDQQPVITGFAPPCGTVYGTDISTEGGPTYGPKFGIYHRESLAGGTIRHGRHAATATYAEAENVTTGVAVQRSIPGRATTRTAGAPALTRGGVAVTVPGRPGAASSGTPTVAPGTVTLRPAGRASTITAGAPSVATGPVTRTAPGRASGASTGRPTLLVGPVTRAVPGRPSAGSAGAPTVTVLRFERLFPGRPSGLTTGAPTVTRGPVTRAVPGRTSTASTGRPTLLVGPVVRTIPGRAPSSASGAPTLVLGGVTRVVPGATPTRAAGAPAVLVGLVTRTPAARAPSSTSGRPTVNVTLRVPGRASSATSGRPSLTPGPVTREVPARGPARAGGDVDVLVGPITRTLEGRGSTSSSGRPTIALGTIVRVPASRPSARTSGDVALEVGTIVRDVPGHDDGVRSGRPALLLGVITRTVEPAPSRGSTGDPTVGVGTITRTPRARAAGRTSGRITLLVGPITRVVDGHQRPERVGVATIGLGVVTRTPEGAPSGLVSGDPSVVRGAAVTIRPGRLTATDRGSPGLVALDEPLDDGLVVIDGW